MVNLIPNSGKNYLETAHFRGFVEDPSSYSEMNGRALAEKSEFSSAIGQFETEMQLGDEPHLRFQGERTVRPPARGYLCPEEAGLYASLQL